MLVTAPEAGREILNSYVKYLPREFRKTVFALDEEHKKSKEKVGDQELYQKLLNIFMDTFCTTPDAKVQVSAFFTQQVEAKINAKVDIIYQVTTRATALMVILWASQRGEIKETEREIQRQKTLVQAGFVKFSAFMESLSEEQKGKCKRAAESALKNLEGSRQEIYDKLNARTHQWNFATHTLEMFPAERDRRFPDTSPASRDIRLNEISVFVSQLFAEEDRGPVEAYLLSEALKAVPVESKEMYIHYTQGCSGELHFKVNNNLKSLFQALAEVGPVAGGSGRR